MPTFKSDLPTRQEVLDYLDSAEPPQGPARLFHHSSGDLQRLSEFLRSSQAQAIAGTARSSVIAIGTDLSEQDREDIFLICLHIQNKVWSEFENTLNLDWYENYTRSLRFYGFAANGAPETVAPDAAADQAGDAAERGIEKAFGKQTAGLAVTALQRLKSNAAKLATFERQCTVREFSAFQVMPCRLIGPGQVDVRIYHRDFIRRPGAADTSFWRHGLDIVQSQERMQNITFQTRFFDEYRERVRQSVERQMLSSLDLFPLD